MSQVTGMDADAVRSAATRLDGEAVRLTSIISAIDNNVGHAEQVWRGHDLEQFVGWWRTQHRPALLRAHESITGLARSLVNNASDQDHASGLGGAAASGGVTPIGLSAVAVGLAGVGGTLRSVTQVTGPAGSVFSTLGAAKNITGATGIGTAFGAFEIGRASCRERV